ncbi:LuxR C-terminal-related transcriptional regulator [Nonomuraea sp. NPDC050790]|uniref:helix-turn-helix transcriptional regulator n=1 Tax=Nonomuraea sp. NPDC050790 TaxID=3364371 RepID=UPI0037A8D1FE
MSVLHGRAAELAAVDRIVRAAREGGSGTLVLRGEPGIGKSALLDHAAAAAEDLRAPRDDGIQSAGLRVLRGCGIESEAELPFAGLHLLLRPALDGLSLLPAPQRLALESAFGLGPAVPADRMLVGLAVLSLLSELATRAPLLCLVDDAQWLDRPSAEALLFAARRLGAESTSMIFAARDGRPAFAAPGLPSLTLTGLGPEDAAALVDERDATLAPEVRARVLAEAAGNPLALIELPLALDADTPGPLPLTDRLQAAFHGQVARLPAPTRDLLLLAAADDSGDLAVVLRASPHDVRHLPPAVEAGLIRLDEADRRIAFRHPLVRAAVYRGATLDQRLDAHRALAESLAGTERADLRAWHLAAAATGTDERAADELERAAAQAAARNGHSAAAAAYERAAELSPHARGRLFVQAAEAALAAGDLDAARALAERARPETRDAPLSRRLARAQAAALSGQGAFRQANLVLIGQVAAGGADDPDAALATLMDAVGNAWFAGDRDMVARTADQLDAIGGGAGAFRLVQDWIVALALERSTDGLPPMAEVVAAARRGRAGPLHLMHIAGLGLIAGLDYQAYHLMAEVTAGCRAQGKIGLLPPALYHLAITESALGRHRDAAGSATEAVTIADDTGQWQWSSLSAGVLAYLAAVEGDEERCRDLAARTRSPAGEKIFSPGAPRAGWALGLLDLAHGRAERALEHLERVAEGPARHQLPGQRCAPDLVEAAVRLGSPERAAGPYQSFRELAGRLRRAAVGALAERCAALLEPDAEPHFRAALHLHEQDSRTFEHARTELLYGEWLRRARRKSEARTHLTAALERFDRVGARPWAERADAELHATGLTIRRAAPGVLAALTPQELQIVRLAAQGLSNRDIAAQLFISPRTVGHHLYKAFPKLGVASRTDLAALPLHD